MTPARLLLAAWLASEQAGAKLPGDVEQLATGGVNAVDTVRQAFAQRRD